MADAVIEMQHLDQGGLVIHPVVDGIGRVVELEDVAPIGKRGAHDRHESKAADVRQQRVADHAGRSGRIERIVLYDAIQVCDGFVREEYFEIQRGTIDSTSVREDTKPLSQSCQPPSMASRTGLAS